MPRRVPDEAKVAEAIGEFCVRAGLTRLQFDILAISILPEVPEVKALAETHGKRVQAEGRYRGVLRDWRRRTKLGPGK